MSLFQRRRLVLHSGASSGWKIDCDSFTAEDWDALAWLISQRHTFGRVAGIPSGGLLLARALESYADPTNRNLPVSVANVLLIVDDVITTGGSFEEFAATVEGPYIGLAVFGRGDPRTYPSWVNPLFQLNSPFRDL